MRQQKALGKNVEMPQDAELNGRILSYDLSMSDHFTAVLSASLAALLMVRRSWIFSSSCQTSLPQVSWSPTYWRHHLCSPTTCRCPTTSKLFFRPHSPLCGCWCGGHGFSLLAVGRVFLRSAGARLTVMHPSFALLVVRRYLSHLHRADRMFVINGD